MGMLEEMARAPAGVAPALSESEDVRRIIREKIARDAALPGARQDIQNTRNFLAEADWNKAVTLIRKGMTPAAALAALGYSAASMAADEPR
jgi:adenine/guanine phosphoribosyltransferase-like PRPP-binding protein